MEHNLAIWFSEPTKNTSCTKSEVINTEAIGFPLDVVPLLKISDKGPSNVSLATAYDKLKHVRRTYRCVLCLNLPGPVVKESSQVSAAILFKKK